jgi:ubiquinone/menaquinone biosynthesis C-methylase UbiE
MEQVFYELFDDVPRQGPGSDASTLKALSEVKDWLPKCPRILDLGCGTGKQTLNIAQQVQDSLITAIDNYEPFLQKLAEASEMQGLTRNVTPLLGDMGRLPFYPNSFDLIWAEGSIFILGVEKALEHWTPLLSKGGQICFSEMVMTSDLPHEECSKYFSEIYPGMPSKEQIRKALETNGYELKSEFLSPYSDWWDEYYTPILGNLEKMKSKYSDNKTADEIIKGMETEIEIHRKYGDQYGYMFFIAVKK